ncbi:phage holin family protein [Pseudonocardia sichuanensis]
MTVPTPPPPPAGPPTDPGLRVNADVNADVGATPVSELVGNVARDLSTLVRQELALARAELRQEAVTTGKAAGALGAAGVAALFAVLFLSLALWAGLSHLMDAGWAGLLVGVLWGIAAAVLAVTGRSRLRDVSPTPERTVDTLSSVPDALRGRRGGTP